MPVPKSTVENSPRKLLRDVVLEKMLAAIQDGTLQAGERLNDEELVQWLGVSRTPIREAIAKLVDYGLVEMEANRYTRIATPTAEQFDDALQVLFGFAELATRWSFPKLEDRDVTELTDIVDSLRSNVGEEDFGGKNADMTRLVAFLIDHTDNALLAAFGTQLLPRTQFLALTQPEFVFWDITEAADPLLAAARGRDGEAGGAVIRSVSRTIADHLASLRTAHAAG